MIISDYGRDKFSLRNREDLSVIKTIKHTFGFLRNGLYYPEQKVVVLGIDNKLVEFDLENMKIIKNVKTMNSVLHLEKVNDDTILIGEGS